MMGPKKQEFWPRINILKGKQFKRIYRWMTVHQMILENKGVQKLKLENNFFNKNWSSILMFLNGKKVLKNSIDFWHQKWTLKVCTILALFDKPPLVISFFFFWICWFLAKSHAFYDPPSLKFHNRTDIIMCIPSIKL